LAGPGVIWGPEITIEKGVNQTTLRAKRQASPLPYRRDAASSGIRPPLQTTVYKHLVEL
jgi:hypothetical protein